MSKSLLVTGAAGFIGSNFVHYWARQHPEDTLVAYDALTYAGNLENLAVLRDNPRFHFVHANVCDTEKVERICLVPLIHLATRSGSSP